MKLKFCIWSSVTVTAILFAFLGAIVTQLADTRSISVVVLLLMLLIWLAFVAGNVLSQSSFFDTHCLSLRRDIAQEYAQVRNEAVHANH